MTNQIESNNEEQKEKASIEFLESLRNDMDKLKKDNELLLQIADKKQLATYYERHQEKIPTHVNLRMMSGKVVLGWRTVKNEVRKDPKSEKYIEDQIIEVVYEDGKSEQFSYMDFVRAYTNIETKVVKTMRDETTGRTKLEVERLDNGEKYEISVEYVN